MKLLLFVIAGISLTVLCWGMYGPVLHRGQHGLQEVPGAPMIKDRLKPLICVGAAYFIVAIIVPVALLISRGEMGGGWNFSGISWSLAAGTAGALGALGIIIALSSGGKPLYVMPLVFGGAPVINVLLSIYWAKETESPSPLFFAGLILVTIGAATVLVFQPKTLKASAKPAVKQTATAEDARTADPELRADHGNDT